MGAVGVVAEEVKRYREGEAGVVEDVKGVVEGVKRVVEEVDGMRVEGERERNAKNISSNLP